MKHSAASEYRQLHCPRGLHVWRSSLRTPNPLWMYLYFIDFQASEHRKTHTERERAPCLVDTLVQLNTRNVLESDTQTERLFATRELIHIRRGDFFSSICRCCCYCCSVSSQPFLGRSSTFRIHEMEIFDKKACVSVYTRWQRRCKFRIFRTNSSDFIHLFSVWSWRHTW